MRIARRLRLAGGGRDDRPIPHARLDLAVVVGAERDHDFVRCDGEQLGVVDHGARLRETNTAIELGDFEWADAALGRVQAIAEQTRQPTQRWNAGFVASGMMCIRGELEAGERLAERALALGQEAGQPDAAAFYGGTIVVNREHVDWVREGLPQPDGAEVPWVPARRVVHEEHGGPSIAEARTAG